MNKILLSLTAIIALGTTLNAGAYGKVYTQKYNTTYNNNNYDIYDGRSNSKNLIDVPVIEYAEISENESIDTENGFYIGIFYSYGMSNISLDDSSEFIEFTGNTNAGGLMGGYDFNKYVGIEYRFTFFSEFSGDTTALDKNTGKIIDVNNFDSDIFSTNEALYLKLKYPITDTFSVYGLVGAGYNLNVSDTYDNLENLISDVSFQYGAGVKYRITESFDIFVDYTSILDDDIPVYDGSLETSIASVNFGLTYRY